MKGLVTALLLSISGVSLAATNVVDIMNSSYQTSRVENFSAQSTLESIRGSSAQLREMNIWSKIKSNGQDSMMLAQFAKPLDIKGSSFLMLQNGEKESDMWVFLPSLGKSRRITSSSKKSSFFGTDFSYADIEHVSPNKFSHTSLRTESNNYVIESVVNNPEQADELGFTKKISWINTTNFLETKVEYYAATTLIKIQLISSPANVDAKNNKWIRQIRVMINVKTGNKTVYRIVKYEIGKPIPLAKFTINALENLN